jgi:hypothetical protein
MYFDEFFAIIPKARKRLRAFGIILRAFIGVLRASGGVIHIIISHDTIRVVRKLLFQ